MQKILSNGLWKTIRAQARKAKRRKTAIAYVTKDLIGYKRGDVLVTDASERAISSGETNAKLLRTLSKRGVCLYHCGDLHAKVLLFDDVAVIGSGNMSNSSAGVLVEAGVITDHASTVSGVASFIEQLIRQSDELLLPRIAQLCKIKVVRWGGRGAGAKKKHRTNIAPIGNRTWLVGVYELIKEPTPAERKSINQATHVLNTRLNLSEDDFDWLRWSGRSRFAMECREGDSLIQIWRSRRAVKHPSEVLSVTPVLLRQKAESGARFYMKNIKGDYAKMSWGNFKRLLKEVGYAHGVSANMARLLDPDMADAIVRRWKATVKS